MGRAMTDKTQARTDRLKAALRENLKRRKAQVRGRKSEGGSNDEPEKADPKQDREG